ncbi:MAG TPA: hypothetical protein VHD90_00270 [Phototrophicaceae bacterium]|nr:hypothetical protein [Phototrophicaceae bacterium]
MSEDLLYELARNRVERRNRRWVWWSVDFAGVVLMLALVALVGNTAFGGAAAALFLAWGGLLALHTLWMARMRHHDSDIEREVARLREASGFEKPKRLELSDDGELIDFPEQSQDKRLKDSV